MNEKHILLAICGMSPAVITETVFQLVKNGDCPDKVVIITTLAGEDVLKNDLFSRGIWKQLLKTLKCNIAFAPNHDHIRLLPSSDGNAFDVTTSNATNRAADFILEVLRQYTENDFTRVTFSVAGGRKSMSSISALCMSLLGRSRDKLCHILVNHPFDDPALNPRFYFPLPGQVHTARDGKTFDSSQAELELSEIPFVRCRYLIEDELNRTPGDYSLMVELANRNATNLHSAPTIELIPSSLECKIGSNAPFKLPLKEFILYWMLAQRRLDDETILNGTASLLRHYQKFADEVRESLTEKYPNLKIEKPDALRRLISNISKQMKDFPNLKPTRSKGEYGIGVEKSKICIRTSGGRPKNCYGKKNGI